MSGIFILLKWGFLLFSHSYSIHIKHLFFFPLNSLRWPLWFLIVYSFIHNFTTEFHYWMPSKRWPDTCALGKFQHASCLYTIWKVGRSWFWKYYRFFIFLMIIKNPGTVLSNFDLFSLFLSILSSTISLIIICSCIIILFFTLLFYGSSTVVLSASSQSITRRIIYIKMLWNQFYIMCIHRGG